MGQRLRATRRARQTADTGGSQQSWRGYLLRRNLENLSMLQRETIWALETANRRTLRAFGFKDELRSIFALPFIQARAALDAWITHASPSRLAPFVKLTHTIRDYRTSIETTIEWRSTNGIAESNSASIGRIRANTCVFHGPQAFITIIMLDRSGGYGTPASPRRCHGSPRDPETVSCPRFRGPPEHAGPRTPSGRVPIGTRNGWSTSGGTAPRAASTWPARDTLRVQYPNGATPAGVQAALYRAVDHANRREKPNPTSTRRFKCLASSAPGGRPKFAQVKYYLIPGSTSPDSYAAMTA